MTLLPDIRSSEHPDDARKLQEEIFSLEATVQQVQQEMDAFDHAIHLRLHQEMETIRSLRALYKSQKKEKKAKRLEQKKRGKNWVESPVEPPVEPQMLPQQPESSQKAADSSKLAQAQATLKRLYKEAVWQVHPDKWAQAGTQAQLEKANALTTQLNAIYRSGDLDELILFYDTVIIGHAIFEAEIPLSKQPELARRMDSLLRKKAALSEKLQQLQSTYTYHVLTTYENPLRFIDELQQHFQEKIKQLQKRTRKASKRDSNGTL